MRAIAAIFVLMVVPQMAAAQTCPAVMNGATRLVVVAADSMHTSAARLTLYVRDNDAAPWRQHGATQDARLGKRGLGWGAGFTQLARAGEPIKRERDRRTPAGIYRIGAPFGFAPSRQANYIQLKAGETVCVDDVKSPAYNTITTRAQVGRASVERMRNFPRYRHGLLIDYPSNFSKPAGSCIFIHIWSASGGATTGCVAVPETKVIELQSFAAPGAVIAILPRPALERFRHCVPNGAR